MAWQLYGHQLLLPVPDLDRTSYFLVLGANPMASNGSLMTVPDFPQRVRDLKARGGRMVVLDPRRTETAKVATEHHFVRPGLRRGAAAGDAARAPRGGPGHSPGVRRQPRPGRRARRRLHARAGGRLPAGSPPTTIRALVREFAAAESAAAYGRMGVSTHGFGSVCQWAIQLLNLLTGNFDREGGVLFPEPAVDTVGRRIVGPGPPRRLAQPGPRHPGVRGRAAGRGRCARRSRRAGDGQIRAMVTIAGNPVLSTPDGAGLARALDGLDFMVAVDIYLNETTRHADVILPPTSALERDQYDLVFHGLAVRNTARFTPAVFAKPDDARHDWEIFRDLTERVQAQGAASGSRTGWRPGRGSRRARRPSSPGCSRPAAARR